MSIRRPDRGEALTTFAGNGYTTDSTPATLTPGDRLKALKRIREVAAAVAARRQTRPPESAPRSATTKSR